MPNISMNKDAHKFAPVMLDVIPLMGLDFSSTPVWVFVVVSTCNG